MEIYTEAELAEQLKMPLTTLGELRKRENWPHLRFGRSVRYTAEQVEQIVRSHTTTDNPHRSEVEELARRTGLTKRSAAHAMKTGRWDDRRS